MAQVAPNQGAAPGADEVVEIGSDGDILLSLKNLNPDLNGDGVIDEHEKVIFAQLKAADGDGDGQITRRELYTAIYESSAQVEKAKRLGGIPIADLNPDTDGDGKIEDWETEVYSRIVAADTDKTGTISVRNLFDFIRSMSAEVKEAAKGGIPISTLNPDTDGDGKVEKWEVEVFERIKAADEDKSGSINVKELFGVIKGAAESDKQKKMFRRLFIVASLLVVLMLFANMGLTAAVVFLAKDTQVSATAGPAKLQTTSGAPLMTAGSANKISPSVNSATRRRLRTRNGRRLIEVMSVEKGACQLAWDLAQISGDYGGNTAVDVDGSTLMTSGMATSTTNMTDKNRRRLDHCFSARRLVHESGSGPPLPPDTSDCAIDPLDLDGTVVDIVGDPPMTDPYAGMGPDPYAGMPGPVSGGAPFGRRTQDPYAGMPGYGMPMTFTVHIEDNFTEDCGVFEDHHARQLRAPTADEVGEWRRRRLEKVAEDEMAEFAHFPSCVVYHCFEGDVKCPVPSGREHCLRWSDAEDKCLEPACMLLDEKTFHERRLQEDEVFSLEPKQCFGDESEVCLLLGEASPASAHSQCFGAAPSTTAQRVKMTALRAGDLVLTESGGAPAITRVVVNLLHLGQSTSSSLLRLHHARGAASFTPEHVLLADGAYVPARDVKVGSRLYDAHLGEVKVRSVESTHGGVVNPLTAAATILVAERGGQPIVASTYPEGIAQVALLPWAPPAVLPLAGGLCPYLLPNHFQAFIDLADPVLSANNAQFAKIGISLSQLPSYINLPLYVVFVLINDAFTSALFFLFLAYTHVCALLVPLGLAGALSFTAARKSTARKSAMHGK